MNPNDREEAAGLAPTANYRYAEVVGERLFVAGQVPHDAERRIVGPGDPSVQATQCLANLRTLLGVHGFSEGDVRQLVIYVVGAHEDLSRAWVAVEEWFGGDVPPATLLGVACLGYREQLVEIDATIVRRG